MPPKAASGSANGLVDPNSNLRKTVKLGDSITNSDNPGFTSLRYNDKPSSVLDNGEDAVLKPTSADGESVSLTLTSSSGDTIDYTGRYTESQSPECLLIFDPITQEVTLERLNGKYDLNTSSTGRPPIPSDKSDDSDFTDPEDGNPYDFRRFIKDIPIPDSEPESPTLEPVQPPKPAAQPSPVKPPAPKKKAATAAAPKTDSPAGSQKGTPKRKPPAKTPGKRAAPVRKIPAEPKEEEKKAEPSSLLLPAKAPSPVPDAQPRSLREAMAAEKEQSESDADDESEDDEPDVDFHIDDADGDVQPMGLFGRKPLGHITGEPISLNKASGSPLVGGDSRFTRQEESDESDADEDEDPNIVSKYYEVPGKQQPPQSDADDDEGDEDGWGEINEEELLNVEEDDDHDDDAVPTPSGYGGGPISMRHAYGAQEEESSEEE